MEILTWVLFVYIHMFVHSGYGNEYSGNPNAVCKERTFLVLIRTSLLLGKALQSSICIFLGGK